MFIARSEYGKLPSHLTPLSGLLLTASDRPWNQVRILQPTISFPPLDSPFLMICQTTAPSLLKVVYSRSNTLSKLSSLVPQQSEYVLVLPRSYHTRFHRNYIQRGGNGIVCSLMANLLDQPVIWVPEIDTRLTLMQGCYIGGCYPRRREACDIYASRSFICREDCRD